MPNRFKVILTREEEDIERDRPLFEKEGFEVIPLPLIKTLELPWEPPEESYDYVVFQSQKAVKFFFKKMENLPPSVRIVAVGQKTRKYLSGHGFKEILIPEEESASGLIKLFKKLPPGKVLIPRSAIGKTELIEFLKEEGFEVTALNIYTTFGVEYSPSEFRKRLKGDFILFYSPSAVRGFFANLQRSGIPLEDLNLNFVAVGKTTKEELQKRGVKEVHIPQKPSSEALIRLLRELARNLYY